MGSRRFFLLALIAFFSMPAPYAAAKWSVPRAVHYLTERQQELSGFKAPPAVDSREELADFAALRRWNRARTGEQCARARSQAYSEYDRFFGDISPFPQPLPAGAAAVLERVKAETDWIASKLKDRFDRPRPFTRDPGLKHCLDKIGGPAYPSGHAAISRVYALALSDLVPARRSEFIARADEVALNRVISGVHYPSDIEAGKKLAEEVYAMFLKSRPFQADMKSLRGYLLKSPAPLAK